MDATHKTLGLDNAINSFSGKNRVKVINSNDCATCDTPNIDFKDDLSKKEYKISGMCQNCQDRVFGG